MKKKWIWLAGVVGMMGAFLVLFARPQAGGAGLTVTSNLSGTLNDISNKELVLVFSDDMIALGANPDGAKFLKIEPSCAGSFLWRGTKTLVFKPKTRFGYSTRYQAAVPAGVRALNGKSLARPVTWKFETPRLQMTILESSSGSKYSVPQVRSIAARGFWVKNSLFLSFNQPIEAKVLRDYLQVCKVIPGKKKWIDQDQLDPVSCELLPAGDTRIEVRFAAPLERETTYFIYLKKGARGREGNIAIQEDADLCFNTAAPFRLDTKKIKFHPCDLDQFRILFSNPLKDSQVQDKIRKYLNILLRHAGTSRPLNFNVYANHYSDQEIDYVSFSGKIVPGDELVVSFSPETENIWGERLGKTEDRVFKVCSAMNPLMEPAFAEDQPMARIKSVRQGDAALYKFRDDLLEELWNPDENRYWQYQEGFLTLVTSAKKLVEREDRVSFQGQDNAEPLLKTVDLKSRFGSDLGFFGFMPTRQEVFNSCNQVYPYLWLSRGPFPLWVTHRRTVDFFIRFSADQLALFAYDNTTGKPISDASLSLKREGVKLLEKIGPSSGLFFLNKELLNNDYLVVRRRPGDFAFMRLPNQSTDREPDFRGELLTDRFFYRPGDEVFIGGILRERVGNRVVVPAARKVSLLIMDEDGQTVQKKEIALDSLGGFSTSFRSEKNCRKGHYTVRAISGDFSWEQSIRIDYYQPNTIETSIDALKPVYFSDETLATTVSGSYLAGNPMANDKAKYALAVQPWPDMQRLNPQGDFQSYRFDLDELFRHDSAEYRKESRFDPQGRLALSIPLNHFRQVNFASMLSLEAIGESAEGKECAASASALYMPGKRICGLKAPYMSKANEDIHVQFLLLDEAGRPVPGKVSLSVYRYDYWTRKREEFKMIGDASVIDIPAGGRVDHPFRLDRAGYYLLKADARDEEGKVTSTSFAINVWDYNWGGGGERLSLIAENTDCRIGETKAFFIQSDSPGWALLTVETDRIVETHVVEMKKMTPVSLVIKKEFFPIFTVHVAALSTGSLIEEELQFRVHDDQCRLQVKINAPDEVKPAMAQKIKVRVTDSQNRGKPAKVFVYAVDEGNLALSSYRTPEWHDSLLFRDPLRFINSQHTYGKNTWIFPRPMIDIDRSNPGLYGCVRGPDGAALAGIDVTIKVEKTGWSKTGKTSAAGYYGFIDLPEGDYVIQAEKGDWKSKRWMKFEGGFSWFDLFLLPSALASRGKLFEDGDPDEYDRRLRDDFAMNGISEQGVSGGVMPMAAAPRMMKSLEKKKEAMGKGAGEDLSSIAIRSDFREVLFFKQVETDERGEAEVEFQTSDQLSAYRIMAVAYSEEAFGSTEKRLLVSKDLLLSEAMPEFARSGDTFVAGVQVSNRTEAKLDVKVIAQPKGIEIMDDKERSVPLDGKSNRLFSFRFHALEPGDAEVVFYAISVADKDGLQKKLRITDNLVSESQLDFDHGRDLKKRIHPPGEVEQPRVRLTVTPSILRPAGKIAEKLIFYAYECLEQRTSKVIPYLLLSEELVSRMGFGADMAQIRKEVEGYIRIVPEFMRADGGLSYYRGGQWTSDYLTLHVLWALHLARRADYTVDAGLLSRIENYLAKADLSNYCQAYYQFLLSLDKKADVKKLKTMYEKRDRISLTARVFLYRAIGYQMNDREKQKVMAGEFYNSLQVEADFAYFDVKEFAYDRDMPFYSSRFCTAMLLQALLEWEGEFALAPRVMNWLLEAPPYEWCTTQTNFWILYAAGEYIEKVERDIATGARAEALGEVAEKKFAGPRDMLKLEKEIGSRKEDFDVNVNADRPVYLTTELNYKLRLPKAESRGITVVRHVYGEDGRPTTAFRRGSLYQVELLLSIDKEVPYAVVDEPLAAGFEIMRQDIATTRQLKEFNRANANAYGTTWLRQEHADDRTVFYTYGLYGKVRIVYFVKALYSGEFTWLPTVVQGMYHPQYFGRSATQKITIAE